jgi:hypothetical protein
MIIFTLVFYLSLFDLILEIPELSNRFFIDSAFYIKLFEKCKIKAIRQLIEEDSDLIEVKIKISIFSVLITIYLP